MNEEILSAVNGEVFGVWFLIGAALVFWMQAGFAMVETGFTRAKNAGNILMKNLMDFCIGTVVFILIGFGLLFGEDLVGLIGKPGFDIFTNYAEFDWSNFVFNLVFCATTATIVSGAMAERTKFLSYCIYSGIIIDTNNFLSKTGVRTFEAAAFLRRNGADVVRVRKMFRDEMVDYKARAETVRHAEVYKDVFAISVCPSSGVESPTVVGAQAANELLNINGMKASFVMTNYQGKIFISARSIDEINVQLIMEKLGGGGHMNIAGAQLEDCTISEAKQLIRNTLDSMLKKGEI